MNGKKSFSNWAGTEITGPIDWLEPEDQKQLKQIVKHAIAQKQRLKVVGSKHSWSGIAKPNEQLVSIDNLNRIISIDAEQNQVRVEAGIKLKDLLEILEKVGLTLPVVGSIAEQTVAGVISTGTHGSSLQKKNLSGYVKHLKWIDGKGKFREASDLDPEIEVVRTGLGAIGIITEVTLETEPAFLLEEESFPMPWSQAMDTLEEMAKSFEFIKWWWLPHTGKVQVYRYSRSDEPPRKEGWKNWLDSEVVNKRAFELLLKLGKKAPGLIPRINGLVSGSYFKSETIVSPSWKALTLAMPPVHRELEYGLPWQLVVPTLERIRKVVIEKKLKVNFILEVRLVKADATWMNPAFGRDSAMIGIYMAESRDLETYFRSCEAIFQELGGRPHWGKEFTMGPGVIDLFPRGRDFMAYCFENDPKGIFRNDFLDGLFESGQAE